MPRAKQTAQQQHPTQQELALRQQLKARKLPTTGNKKILTTCLRTHLIYQRHPLRANGRLLVRARDKSSYGLLASVRKLQQHITSADE